MTRRPLASASPALRRGLRSVDPRLKPVARALDADKMARLGIRNTMRLAKLYNGALYGDHQAYRTTMFEQRFEQLVTENGRLTDRPPPVMADGYALDTSGSLPHLDELLAQADEVIAERAGTGEADDRYRAFFRNLIRVEDLDRWTSFLDFATSSELLTTAAGYLGCVPALSKTLPTGVRFVESGKHLDGLAHLPPRDSQLFHIDPYDHPMVYVIVLLRDTTPEMGPFTFLPASVSARAAQELGYWSRGRPYRLSDDEIYSVVDRGETIELAHPRGTVLFVDTSRCFHYGARNGEVPRFQMMYGFTSVARSDFSETYMPSFSYRVRPTDSRLRKLVLDRRAHDV